MTDGRWLAPGDERAVVLTSNYLSKAPGTMVGDLITLEIAGEQSEWRIVGFIEELIPPVSPAWAYVPLDAYTRLAGGVGRTDTLRVSTIGHAQADHEAATAVLERQLAAQGFEVRLIRSRSEDRAILSERFNILTVVLSIMSLLIGFVGGLGLAGTMSINVLERTREIGIMRAIGAADGAIRQIVLSEGLTIATLAWLIGALVSLPLSYAMCYFFGKVLLNAPLIWSYALPAVAMWLGIMLLIAAAASLLPARAAVRLTVREVLAYE
jgi:putative ABC transport system permease protein